jgi:Trypsin-co-occurring domain 2
MSEIKVADAINKLRAELLDALQQGPQSLQFAVNDIDLELALTVSREGEGSVGIKWLVVDVAVQGKISSEVTHRVTLKLQPMKLNDDGKLEPLLVKDRPVREPK